VRLTFCFAFVNFAYESSQHHYHGVDSVDICHKAARLSKSNRTQNDDIHFFHSVHENPSCFSVSHSTASVSLRPLLSPHVSMSTDEGDRVLNIGAGMGGPARYLAGQYKCNVVAVELQEVSRQQT
jgi:hypothetical protein